MLGCLVQIHSYLFNEEYLKYYHPYSYQRLLLRMLKKVDILGVSGMFYRKQLTAALLSLSINTKLPIENVSEP